MFTIFLKKVNELCAKVVLPFANQEVGLGKNKTTLINLAAEI